jgi:hypothetical protein
LPSRLGVSSADSRKAIRAILLGAIKAAKYGIPPDPEVAQSVIDGDRKLTLDMFEFDSLAWMEFCIAVESQSGEELTPEDIIDMHYFFEIEEWLRARL